MRIHGVIYGLTLSLLGSFTIMELLRHYTKVKALLTLGLLIFSVRDVLITYNKRYFEGRCVYLSHTYFARFRIFYDFEKFYVVGRN